jgi:hypothetical protein
VFVTNDAAVLNDRSQGTAPRPSGFQGWIDCVLRMRKSTTIEAALKRSTERA